MKKYFAILSIFALCACAKELAPERKEVLPYSETLTARIVNTKVNINDAGKFSWSEGDQIAVHRSVNGYETVSLSLDGVFGVHLSEGETRDGYAIYPASIADENASDASNLAVVLPNAYDIPKAGMGDYSPLPMVAVNDPASEDVLFQHLGGIFRLELMHLPFETQKISINLGKRVTGTFLVEGLDTDSPFISLPDEDGEDIVYTFKSYITSSTETIIINVPVPVGTYNTLSYKIYDRYGNLMSEDSEDIAITVERADGYEVMQDLTIDVSRIPLCLKMADVGEIIIKNPLLLTMEYSNDNENWTSFDIPEKSFVLKHGDCLFLRGNNSTYATGSGINYKHTSISAKATCYVYGNIMSLITPYPDDFSQLKTLTESYTFYRLFEDNTFYIGTSKPKLLNHPTMDFILPATTLAPHCYEEMFYAYGSCGISRMSLPATELATACYKGMFTNVKQAIEIETLPATTLASYCYQNMFEGSNIVTAPSLPVTTMEYDWYDCYNYMFEDCTSLVNAPELPATVLASRCYSGMFYGCSSLVDAPELPATVLDTECYMEMFSGCTSLVNAPQLPATQLGYDPENESSYAFGTDCYNGMFSGCTSLVNAPALPATLLDQRCYQNMFSGCTSLVNAPDLPALVLRPECYAGMFSGCSSLTHVKAMFTSAYDKYVATDIPSAVSGWLTGVAENGTYVMNEAATYSPSDIGVPSLWTVTTATE